jgi:hypothetical protein
MRLHDPPYPEYREAGELPTHDYRVVFWSHQSPPPGIPAERMGWAELTIDVADAPDVHDVIAWAEQYLEEFAEEYPGQAHTYCLYAKVPDQTWLLHVAGANPTAAPGSETFGRMHPFHSG